jgi:hypothetical protein
MPGGAIGQPGGAIGQPKTQPGFPFNQPAGMPGGAIGQPGGAIGQPKTQPGFPFNQPNNPGFAPGIDTSKPSIELDREVKSAGRTVGATMIISGIGTMLLGLCVLGGVGFLVVNSMRSSVSVPKKRKRD